MCGHVSQPLCVSVTEHCPAVHEERTRGADPRPGGGARRAQDRAAHQPRPHAHQQQQQQQHQQQQHRAQQPRRQGQYPTSHRLLCRVARLLAVRKSPPQFYS